MIINITSQKYQNKATTDFFLRKTTMSEDRLRMSE